MTSLVLRVQTIAPLSPEQKEAFIHSDDLVKAKSFQSEKRKNEFLMGRYLLNKTLLEKEPKWEVNTLRLSYDKFGKPFFSDSKVNEKWKFNIAHSSHSIALALSKFKPVGVDIESIERFAQTRVSKKLHTEERNRKSPLELCSIWSRKEALVKQSGESLLTNLHFYNVLESKIQSQDSTLYLKSFSNGKEVLSLASEDSLENLEGPEDFKPLVIG